MARGGSRGRRTSYVRDNSGRFASTPGGGPPKRSTPATRRAARAKVTGGTLGARSSLRRSRTKLAAKNPADRSLRGSLSLRAQKGAVTRGANRLGKVRAASTVRMAGKGPAGVIRGGRKVVAKPVVAPRDYRRGRSAAAGYKPKTDRTLASSQVGTRANLSESQRAEAQTAKQRFGVRSTAQRARMRAGSYDPAKQGGGRQVFRTRAEARKAYLKRAAATKSTASKSYNDGRYVGDGVKTGTKGSARIRTAAVAQGNLLTGKADNVKVRKARSFSGRSALGGAMRREAKSAKPVAAPRSSVRVIRPNRPAMRPGPGPDRGKISEYVDAVRGSRRRLSSAKPGTANAAEATQGLKDNRRALSRRIQRERGARRGLKPSTSLQVLTGTVPAPPARRVKTARPSGTLAKPKGLKPGAIAARKAKAAASGARSARATTNYNRAQKAALEAQQRVNRRRSPKNLAALARADKSLKTAARAYRILVGLGGEKMAVARKPSPKGAGPRIKAARPAGTVGTVAKPKGLKPGAIAGRKAKGGAAASTPQSKKGLAAKRKPKTEQELLWQASKIIGKANKKSAAAIANVGKLGFSEVARQIRRNNRRSVLLVPRALRNRGLLEQYMRLTAPADGVYMRPAGPGIKPPRPRR